MDINGFYIDFTLTKSMALLKSVFVKTHVRFKMSEQDSSPLSFAEFEIKELEM